MQKEMGEEEKKEIRWRKAEEGSGYSGKQVKVEEEEKREER